MSLKGFSSVLEIARKSPLPRPVEEVEDFSCDMSRVILKNWILVNDNSEDGSVLASYHASLYPNQVLLRSQPEGAPVACVPIVYCGMRTEPNAKISASEKTVHRIELFTAQCITNFYMVDFEAHARWTEALRRYTLSTDNIKEDYDLGENIGKGNFGSVVRAKQKATGKNVAIKILNKSRIETTPEEDHHIINELVTIASLDHPRCVQLIAVYEDETSVFMVMNLFKGSDLLFKCLIEDKMHAEVAALYLYQIVSILSYLSQMGIVHCDIKPQNLLFSSNDADAQLCLVDFGFAFNLGPKGICVGQSGTLGFAAPEVLSLEPTDCRADIFSTGVVLFIMLTGETPDILQLVTETEGGLCRYFEKHHPPVPEWIVRILCRMLSKDFRERPTANELLADPALQNFLSQARGLSVDIENLSDTNYRTQSTGTSRRDSKMSQKVVDSPTYFKNDLIMQSPDMKGGQRRLTSFQGNDTLERLKHALSTSRTASSTTTGQGLRVNYSGYKESTTSAQVSNTGVKEQRNRLEFMSNYRPSL